MNFIIILIYIQITENVICVYLNSSFNGSLGFTLISQYRLKRAPSEYTRWRPDFEPTEEFIVKVFEEDSPARDSQVAPVGISKSIPESVPESLFRGGRVPDDAQSAEIGIDPNTDFGPIINRFSNLNTGDSEIAPVPVYSNNKIISQKKFKGKETKYQKVKYMSVQNENQDALLGSGFLSKLDSPVQQFAPIEPDVTQERISPLLQIKPHNSDLKFVSQPNTKATRTTSKSDIVFPMRTFNTEKVIPIRTSITEKYSLRNIVTDNFGPLRTSTTESFSLPNIITDDYSPFEYIHPIRTTPAVKPLRKLKKLFNMRTGTAEAISTKEKVTIIDEDYDKNYESIVVETNKNKKNKIVETDLAKEMECEEIELGTTEASTVIANSTFMERKLVSDTTNSDLASLGTSRRHSTKCTVIKNREFDGSPRTLHEIVTQLKTWAENSPVAKWVDITNGNYTIMENPIYMIIVDDLSKGQIASAKETVLIVAGIRGKDHYAVSAAMSLLHQLIDKSESNSDLHLKYRFWIIPVLNPDGYDYSMTFPLRRHWFKNLRQTWNTVKDEAQACQGLGVNCTIQTCYGVNLDRNFEYQWIPPKELEAEHRCGLLYAGPRQLSEVETRTLTQYLDKKHIHAFIAYKEGEVLGVLYPYSHTKKKRPLDNFYRVRALRAATAASVAGGRTYVYGQTSEYLPLYAGGIEDWVDGHLGIDNTYSIMMMTKTDDKEDTALMERVSNEAFAATHALLFPSDFDQTYLPLRSRDDGTKISTELIVFVIFAIFGNG